MLPTPPNLLPIFGEKLATYQVASPWSCSVTLKTGEVVRIDVPAGFICDGASIPRVLWWFTPPDGLHRSGSVAHDLLYALLGKLANRVLSREEADFVFLCLLNLYSTPHAKVMWRAVRCFGWSAWNNSTGVPRVEPLRYQIT